MESTQFCWFCFLFLSIVMTCLHNINKWFIENQGVSGMEPLKFIRGECVEEGFYAGQATDGELYDGFLFKVIIDITGTIYFVKAATLFDGAIYVTCKWDPNFPKIEFLDNNLQWSENLREQCIVGRANKEFRLPWEWVVLSNEELWDGDGEGEGFWSIIMKSKQYLDLPGAIPRTNWNMRRVY